jgi:hypothetical protein
VANRGRPSKYKPEFAEQARKLCALGATDRELAEFFEVAESSVSKWKLEYPEFSEALKRGKEVSDERVEHSLYRRAVGYSFDSVHVSNYQGEVTLTPIVQHVPPDTTACIFWLKNRRKEQWRDKIEVDGKVDHVHATVDAMEAARRRALEQPRAVN